VHTIKSNQDKYILLLHQLLGNNNYAMISDIIWQNRVIHSTEMISPTPDDSSVLVYAASCRYDCFEKIVHAHRVPGVPGVPMMEFQEFLESREFQEFQGVPGVPGVP
jgi:hypothetical protein